MARIAPWNAGHTFTTTGTGTITLGAALTGAAPFGTGGGGQMADGDDGLFMAETFDPVTKEPTGTWQIWIGTIGGGGTTLTFDTLVRSSTGSQISWAAGTKRVFGIAAQDADPLSVANPPITPGAGILSLGRGKIAEFPFLAFKGASGLERLIQPFVGTIPMSGVTFFGGSTNQVGGTSTVVGTVTALDVSSTDVGTRTPRGNVATSATAGNVAGIRSPNTTWFVGNSANGGGVFFLAAFTLGTVVSDQRAFFGPRSSTSAPTNVAPTTLTNSMGLGTVDGSPNWHIVFGGSAAQTPIDLGANFPSRGTTNDKIQFALYWPPGDNGGFYYEVNRNEGAFVASGFVPNTSPGTTLPASTTAMSPNNSYWTNNATASIMSMRTSCILTLSL